MAIMQFLVGVKGLPDRLDQSEPALLSGRFYQKSFAFLLLPILGERLQPLHEQALNIKGRHNSPVAVDRPVWLGRLRPLLGRDRLTTARAIVRAHVWKD